MIENTNQIKKLNQVIFLPAGINSFSNIDKHFHA